MASHHHDALWPKLHELELQLAAYKLLRAPRGEDAACRGRQYEAYMRRHDARREAAWAPEQRPAKAQQPLGTRVAGRSKPMKAARDMQEVKTTPTVSIPTTPRRESIAMPRSRTVNGATGSPTRSHHQKRSSLGAPADFSDSPITPRPFLKRGTGTGGAARLQTTPWVHDLPSIDAPTSTPRPPPQQEHGHGRASRHVRSVSELPFDTAARARKRWGSPERPAAIVSAADSRSDFSKGLRKLLSFVRKGGKADADPAAVPSTGGRRKPVGSKGWPGRMAACSLLDVPFDRASLDEHRFPMTRKVGIPSGAETLCDTAPLGQP